MSLPPKYISYSPSSITTTVHVSHSSSTPTTLVHISHYHSTCLTLSLLHHHHSARLSHSLQHHHYSTHLSFSLSYHSHSICHTLFTTITTTVHASHPFGLLVTTKTELSVLRRTWNEKNVPDDVRTEIDTTLESLRDTHLLDAK